MLSVGGARGAFRSNYSNKKVPSASTVTYEGLFNSTFFKLNSKEEKKSHKYGNKFSFSNKSNI